MSKDLSSDSKKRVEEENDSPTLPEDVILDIIVRNSAKDACRARTLSKAMYYATYEDFFIRNHCEKVKKDETIIISFATNEFRKQHFYYLRRSGQPAKHVFTQDFRRNYASDSILHPCNGLVCFTGISGYGIYLCNPGMKQFKSLSRSGAMRALHGAYRSPRYALAFDTSCNEYTLVNVIHDRSIDGRDRPVRCEYLRLSEGRWHGEVANECPLPLSNFHTPVVIHNKILWRVSQRSLGPESPGPIVSFDLETMSFSIISHPKTFLIDNKKWPCLGKMLGFVCLSDFNPSVQHCINLYILTDHENPSWTKLRILVRNGYPELAIPIGFICGRFFFRIRWGNYDVITCYYRMYHGGYVTQFTCDGRTPIQFSVFPYSETIVGTRDPRMRWGLRPHKRIASD